MQQAPQQGGGMLSGLGSVMSSVLSSAVAVGVEVAATVTVTHGRCSSLVLRPHHFCNVNSRRHSSRHKK
jgi:hypothetical protein